MKKEEPVPDKFKLWWYPTGVDPKTGVSVGGQPDAERIWARTDDGGKTYARKRYGYSDQVAWGIQEHRDAYNGWRALGEPPPTQPFESYALPLEEQKKRWAEVMEAAKGIGKVDQSKPIDPEDTEDHGYDER